MHIFNRERRIPPFTSDKTRIESVLSNKRNSSKTRTVLEQKIAFAHFARQLIYVQNPEQKYKAKSAHSVQECVQPSLHTQPQNAIKSAFE